jgi:hypothetical protein
MCKYQLEVLFRNEHDPQEEEDQGLDVLFWMHFFLCQLSLDFPELLFVSMASDFLCSMDYEVASSALNHCVLQSVQSTFFFRDFVMYCQVLSHSTFRALIVIKFKPHPFKKRPWQFLMYVVLHFFTLSSGSGIGWIRTTSLLLAREVLFQLSYDPDVVQEVGFEPTMLALWRQISQSKSLSLLT